MAIVGGDVLTLSLLKQRLGPDDKVAPIIEVLERQDEMLEDIPWMEGNLTTGHVTTLRSALPSGTWRAYNEGVANTVSSTGQVTFNTGMLFARTAVDKQLLRLNNNAAQARWSESKAQLQGLTQNVADAIIYGDPVANPSTDVKKFAGLHYYFKDNTTANTKDHIISAAGNDTDLTSIWIVAWGDDTVCGIYPKGMTAGLEHDDLGEDDVLDGSSNPYRVLKDEYRWFCGLAVMDWRAVVRICNIDKSALISTTANQQALVNYLVEGLEKIPAQYRSRAKIYMNSTVRTSLRLGIIANVTAGGGLTYENVAGKQVMMFDGHPVRVSNAITTSETTIS